ncbi:MAG: hypothetical protein V4543_13195 [Bacteroidota bacterium]
MNPLITDEAKLKSRKEQDLTSVIRSKCAEIAYAYLGASQSFISTSELSNITGYTTEQIHASAGTFKSLMASDTIQLLTEKLLRSIVSQAIEGNISAARLYIQMVNGQGTAPHTSKADSDDRTFFKHAKTIWRAQAESKKMAEAEMPASDNSNKSSLPQNIQASNAAPAHTVQISKPAQANPVAELASMSVSAFQPVINPVLPSPADNHNGAHQNGQNKTISSADLPYENAVTNPVNRNTNQAASEQVDFPAKTVHHKSTADRQAAAKNSKRKVTKIFKTDFPTLRKFG